MNEKQSNKVFLRGEVVSEKRFSHEVYGEGFYETDLAVKRLSGQRDVIPVTVSERLMENEKFEIGSTVSILGQFRSYNKIVDGKSKLILTVFVREVVDYPEMKNPNGIVLSGYVCKQPTFRTTPFEREIADLLIAVNRAYNKSDYLPCIVWGRNARFVKNLPVGEKVCVYGRIQSREYQKRISDKEVKTLTAYEISVCKIAAYDNVENFDLDAELGLAPKENEYLKSDDYAQNKSKSEYLKEIV